MSQKNDILLDVSKEKMSNKDYELSPLVLSYFQAKGVDEDGCRIVSKKAFKDGMRKILHKSYYKVNKLIDAYLTIGVIEEVDDENYKVNKVQAHFVGLARSTAIYFMDCLSDNALKVYCYLLNKYNLHQAYYNFEENYKFSKTEILNAIGLTKQQKSLYMLDNILATLEKQDLIQYNHTPCPGKRGTQGWYLELYKVNQFSNVQIDVAKNWAKKHITSPEVIEQINIPSVELSEENQKFLELTEEQNRRLLMLGHEQQELYDTAHSYITYGAHTEESLPVKYKGVWNLVQYGK